jgi:hypothetical protein
MMLMGMRAIRSFLPVGFDTASILSFPHLRVSRSSLIALKWPSLWLAHHLIRKKIEAEVVCWTSITKQFKS